MTFSHRERWYYESYMFDGYIPIQGWPPFLAQSALPDQSQYSMGKMHGQAAVRREPVDCGCAGFPNADVLIHHSVKRVNVIGADNLLKFIRACAKMC